jgi:hypothetical protein
MSAKAAAPATLLTSPSSLGARRAALAWSCLEAATATSCRRDAGRKATPRGQAPLALQ